MADLDQTIKIILSGEDRVSSILSSAGRGIESFGNKFGTLNDSLASMTQPFADLAGGILKVDAALAALTVGGLTYAFVKSKEFESATVELKKVVGDIPEDLAAATDNAKELSDTYGEASTSILLSTASFKQAGYDIQDSMTLAKNALDLVIAGDIDAANASDLLIATLKGFNAPASEATRLIDVLNEVSNNYATDVEQLAIGMAELSPIASTMGFSFEETAGILTPVIEIFRSGGEAAVALKTGLLRLVDDNASVVAALDSIGVAQKDANGQLRSGQDILYDVSKAFTTLDDNQKLFVASQLVGVEQAARMVTVFDNLGKSTEITATALNSAGSAAAEVAARLESSEVAVNRFVTGFQNLAVAVGDQFRDAAKEAINGGTDIENALTRIVESGALDELFEALESQLGGLGEYLSEVAEALPEAFDDVNFSGLLSALSGLSGEISGLFDGLDLTTPEGLATAIQKVVDTIEGLVNVTSGMVEGAAPFIKMLSDMAEKFISMDSESQKSIGSVTGFMGALNKVTGPIGSVTDAISGLGTGLQAIAGVQLVDTILDIENLGTKAAAASKLLGTAGLVAAAGAGGYAIGTMLNDGIDAVVSKLSGSDSLGALIYDLTHKTEDLSTANADVATDLQSAATAVQEVTTTQRDYLAEVKAVSAASYDWQEAIPGIIKHVQDLGYALDETGGEISPVVSEFEQLASVVRNDLGMAGETIKGTFSTFSTSSSTAANDLKKVTDESEKLHAQMLQLASDERIKAMELTVDFKIAQVKADAEVMQSIIDGVATSVESTSMVMGDLLDAFSDATTLSDKWYLQDLLDEQNERQGEALDLQKKLTEAQIDLIEKRAQAYDSGEAMITVTGDGLAEHLRALMWEVFKEIRIEMNESVDAMLMGIS